MVGIPFSIEDVVRHLSRTPGVLRAMLADLPDTWVEHNYGTDTFSVFDIVGHLIHGEREDWIPRMRIILEHGTSQAFEPFDRYAMFAQNKGKRISVLLDEFARLRDANIKTLKATHLSSEELARTGTHPELGRVTLQHLLATWVVHDLNHVAQVAKALAFQYGDEVGPWRAYISVLKPPAPAG